MGLKNYELRKSYRDMKRVGYRKGYKQGKQDATKEIREVWERYENDNEYKDGDCFAYAVLNKEGLYEIIDAIKACGKRCGWIEEKEE